VAQWLMTKKHLENWIFWVAVDIVYVGMYAYKELMLTAVLYALFLVLAWRGYVQWRDSQSPVTA
jgi:nicotinamide mononucleotide transporter